MFSDLQDFSIDPCLDRGYAIGQASWLNPNNLEPELTIRFFVNPLKPQRILVTDPPRSRRRHKPQAPHKKDLRLKHTLRLDSCQLARQRLSYRKSQVARQRSRADHRAIVKLNPARPACHLCLPLPLQTRNGIDKRNILPCFVDAPRLPKCDHVRRGLLHHAETIQLQLAENGSLARPGRPGQDESIHVLLFDPLRIQRALLVRALATNRRTFSASFFPCAASTPLATSTPHGCNVAMASRTFSGVRPPAAIMRVPEAAFSNSVLRATAQSNVVPVPPTAVAVRESTRTALTLGSAAIDATRSAACSPKCTTPTIRTPAPRLSRSRAIRCASASE